MSVIANNQTKNVRLRFVFGGEVRSYGLPPDATFGDIARTLSDLRPLREGGVVAIDVKFAGREAAAPRA